MVTNHLEYIKSLMLTVVTLSEEYYAEPSELIDEIDEIIPMTKVDRRKLLATALEQGMISMPVTPTQATVYLKRPDFYRLDANKTPDGGLYIDSYEPYIPLMALVAMRFRLEGIH